MLSNLINSFLPRQRAATVQTLGHPAAGVVGWWSSEEGATGEVVTEETAYKIAAFWCGVRVISEILASFPCILYNRQGDSKKERASKDPRYYLVHDHPNEEIDAYHFFEAATAHAVVTGNGFAKVTRNGFNQATELDLRLPNKSELARDDSGNLILKCSEPKEIIEYPDLINCVGFSYDGVKGYRLTQVCSQVLGIALAGDRYSGGSLKNNGVPSGVLEHPMQLTDDARRKLRRDWDEVHGGASKAARLAIIHGGMKYSPISWNPEDMQVSELRKLSVQDMARILRLPNYILNDMENSAVRANIEQQNLDLIQICMMPWVKRWERSLSRSLLTREERQTMYFEFLFDSLLRGDTKSRYEAHAIARQWGWRNVNEIKQIENENSIGPDGDVYLQPLNMGPAGMPPANPKAELPEAIAKEYQKALSDTVRETVDVAKQMKRAIKAGIVRVDKAFAEFGVQLEQTVSTERETFKLIKEDIEKLGKTTQVRVIADRNGAAILSSDGTPLSAEVDTRLETAVRELLTQAIRKLLRIEGAEAVKAARGQAMGQNFIKRIEAFYDSHALKVREALEPAVKASGCASVELDKISFDHVRESKENLIDCADGSPDEFEERIKACVDRWEASRLAFVVGVYHSRLFGGTEQ